MTIRLNKNKSKDLNNFYLEVSYQDYLTDELGESNFYTVTDFYHVEHGEGELESTMQTPIH